MLTVCALMDTLPVTPCRPAPHPRAGALPGPLLLLLLLCAACGGEQGDPAAADTLQGTGADTAPRTVFAQLSTDPHFSTFVAAVDTAELRATLQGAGPLTVFAPTDAAFAALPPGTVDELFQPDNQDQLLDLLLYHVLADTLTAAELAGRSFVTTLQGDDLPIVALDQALRIGEATVTTADRHAGNGLIHVIDQVLLPPSSDESR